MFPVADASSVISGPLADRWGSRRLAVAGMILTGAGLVAAGFARTLIQVYVAYGLGIGLGIGLAYVPALGAVSLMVTVPLTKSFPLSE